MSWRAWFRSQKVISARMMCASGIVSAQPHEQAASCLVSLSLSRGRSTTGGFDAHVVEQVEEGQVAARLELPPLTEVSRIPRNCRLGTGRKSNFGVSLITCATQEEMLSVASFCHRRARGAAGEDFLRCVGFLDDVQCCAVCGGCRCAHDVGCGAPHLANAAWLHAARQRMLTRAWTAISLLNQEQFSRCIMCLRHTRPPCFLSGRLSALPWPTPNHRHASAPSQEASSCSSSST